MNDSLYMFNNKHPHHRNGSDMKHFAISLAMLPIVLYMVYALFEGLGILGW